jgi:hypothetical protein
MTISLWKTTHSYNDAISDALPDDPASPNPGPGTNLPSVDGKTQLTPLLGGSPPDATVAYYLQISFQATSAHQFLGFMNNTVCNDPLSFLNANDVNA